MNAVDILKRPFHRSILYNNPKIGVPVNEYFHPAFGQLGGGKATGSHPDTNKMKLEYHLVLVP